MTDLLGYDTLMDVVNQYSSLDGSANFIEAAHVLTRTKPFLRYMHMQPSNQIMSNIGSRDSYLPTPGTRRFNEGVSITTSHSVPFNDGIAMVQDYSEVDYDLYRIQNDPARWRNQKDSQKVEALGQKMEDLIIYGNEATDQGAINGLATRFNSTTRRPNGNTAWPYNVVSAGGSGGDTTSLYVIQTGPGKVWCTYPKNLPGGLQIADKGQHTIYPSATTRMEVLRTHFSWFLGLVVEDERCVQRYANIEVTGATYRFDEDILITLLNNLPDRGVAPGTIIFASRSICNDLDIRAKDKNNVQYTPDNVWGGTITKFKGIPVLMAEMIDETETAIV